MREGGVVRCKNYKIETNIDIQYYITYMYIGSLHLVELCLIRI